MDLYKFHRMLLELLEDEQDDNVIQAAYDATTKMMAYETNELRIANALVDTAHTLLVASRGLKGVDAFAALLENRLEESKRSNANTSIRLRTEAINTVET